MIFLIEYDRGRGRLVQLRAFEHSKRKVAEDLRLDIELQANREGWDREVVLMDAENEEALRKTHRRYFEDLDEMLRRR